jgi:hypothetical protein
MAPSSREVDMKTLYQKKNRMHLCRVGRSERLMNLWAEIDGNLLRAWAYLPEMAVPDGVIASLAVGTADARLKIA